MSNHHKCHSCEKPVRRTTAFLSAVKNVYFCGDHQMVTKFAESCRPVWRLAPPAPPCRFR